jgi:hypothetical protein
VAVKPGHSDADAAEEAVTLRKAVLWVFLETANSSLESGRELPRGVP